jgi:GT2 family glycosyltransferase
MSDPTPAVYVGIVTYNSLADLPRLMLSVREQRYPRLEVTLLDNASSDGTADWIRKNADDCHWLLLKTNLGFGRGHNRIYQTWREQMTPSDLYMALNPDVSLMPAYIERVVADLAATGAGWGSGKLMQPDARRLYSAGHALCRDGYAFAIGHGLPDDGRFDEPRDVFGAPGAAALYRREMLEVVAPGGNLYDPRMFMYYEDVDLDWRAQLAGWRCRYVPGAVGYHRGSQARPRLRAEALANRYLSVMKNADRRDYLTYNLPLIVLHCTVRLLLTPRLGAFIIGKLSQYGAQVRAERTAWRVNRADMRRWFAWAGSQPTAQPRTLIQRLRAFYQKRTSSAR